MNLPRALPWLDERRSALLAEIGVPAWWQPRALLPRPPGADGGAPAIGATARRGPPPRAQETESADAMAAVRSGPASRAGSPTGWAVPVQAEPTAATSPVPPQPPLGDPAPPPDPAPHADIATLDWPALEAAIHACQRCGLAACRQRAVPGVGDRRPTWLIVGEAPGEEEDRQGEPFVGRAGRLLDRMLAALDLQRGHGVYIANVLKCRPPRNRNPEPEEIARCAPYLLRQIALLQPRLVLALGRFAAQTLLAEGGCLPPAEAARAPLGRLRGRVFQARLGELTLPVVVSYHPAYLLRNPVDKGKAWADLCLAAETLADVSSSLK
ncbi:uracil-DNA glycosylase, family 4 [Tepidimonas alkaliphilus]|uniref:Type-4 uracil-DNA glycosylase n=1 Tax=Tepidimonas alkaliphilus TaxID=2588942 RepID=A0A554W791_9BURK|nr:uracil-DNA glycosylase [Tepidimonas alkaliphilus]TSE19430.1 uracil-DNA glycosylase, family 4 [Tepidimonas alkaliphilus]